MRKKIIFSLALGIMVGLIINVPFPSVSSVLIGIISFVISFIVLLPFGHEEVEILEEYIREPEDPEEILP